MKIRHLDVGFLVSGFAAKCIQQLVLSDAESRGKFMLFMFLLLIAFCVVMYLNFETSITRWLAFFAVGACVGVLFARVVVQ